MSDPAEKQPFYVHCGKCSHEWALAFLPMDLGLFVKMGKSPRCPMCGSKNVRVGQYPKPTAEGDPIAWLTNGDTGNSSKAIWGVMMGRDVSGGRAGWTTTPADPQDFGRCYRLLKVMPSWRARMPEVAACYPEWKPLVDAWDDLTALYEEELPAGRCPKLYDRMQALVAEGRKK